MTTRKGQGDTNGLPASTGPGRSFEDAKRVLDTQQHALFVERSRLLHADITQRIRYRSLITRILLELLSVEVIALGFAVYYWSRLGLSDTALSVIFTGTIGQTIIIVHTIVKFIFKEIDYRFKDGRAEQQPQGELMPPF